MRWPRRSKPRCRSLFVLPFAAALLAAPAQAGLEDVYANRTAMMSLDQRCGLFTGPLRTSLALSRVQARNAGLRAGISAARMRAVEESANMRAGSIACTSPVLKVEADKVRSAFSAYGRILRLDFPGRFGDWKADRTVLDTRQDGGRWALRETGVSPDPSGSRLGLLAYNGRTALFVSRTAGATPASARLVLRDPERAPDPYLPGPLTPPPRSVSSIFYGASRIDAPEGGVGFLFSDAAAQALALLDPREPVVVEFVYPAAGGERVEKVLFEVGDFAPAAAFIALGR